MVRGRRQVRPVAENEPPGQPVGNMTWQEVRADFLKVEDGWREVKDELPDVSEVIKHLSAAGRDASCLKVPMERAAQAVFEAELDEIRLPARSELREKLDEIEGAVETLSRLVRDPHVLAAVPGLDQAFEACDGCDVPGALARILRRTEPVKQQLPPGPGRATCAPFLGRINSRLLCARVIVEAWRRLRDRAPNPLNKTAQLACFCLWHAAGGKQKPSARVLKGDADEGDLWQRHLREALKLDGTGAAEVVTRNSDSTVALNAMVVSLVSALFTGSCTEMPQIRNFRLTTRSGSIY
jgi:hypothetical protein